MVPRKIALLTDSCADLTPEIRREQHIYCVPLRILCTDGEYLDGETIHSADIYQRLRAGELPHTSLPRTEDLEQVLRQILSDGCDGIVAVMLSSGLSGTYNLTRLAAEELESQIPMRVYDSLSASIGESMVLLQIAEDLRSGIEWTELTQHRIPALIQGTQPYFSVDTLEYLRRGGRIGTVTAAAGTLLQIKPILTFAPDGQLTSTAKARGRHQVADKLVELAVKRCGEHRRYNIAIANGGDPEGMELLRQKMTAALPHYDHLWQGEIDATLSVYIGDGILGVGVQTLD